MAPAAYSQRNAAEILGQAARNPGQFGVLAGADRAQVNVQAEQPSRQDRCLGYGLINAGRRGREYGEREAAPWLDRIHASRHGRRVRHLGRPARQHWPAPCDAIAANRSDYYPAWSPDGSALLFERRKLDPAAAGGDEALYAVNADGGDFRQITHCCGECWSDGEAARSPGGARIAFSRAIVRAPRRALRVAIDVANADGGLADEIDAAGAPRPSRACAPMATPGRRLAPGSASPARLLSNARDNVASPAVPHDNDRR